MNNDVRFSKWINMVQLSHINISINNINLTIVKSSEFVGIIIDQNVDWKLHILHLK